MLEIYNYYLICKVKIQELEMKLQEEEHERKLLQDKANQVSMSSFLWLPAPTFDSQCLASPKSNAFTVPAKI